MEKPNFLSWNTETAAAVLVIVSLLLLIFIRMGFRGINVMGLSVAAN